MSRLFFTLAIAAILGIVLWLWMPSERGSGVGVRTAPSPEERAVAVPADLEAPDRMEPPAPPGPSVAERSSASAPRTETALDPVLVSGVVVDRHDNPVADALVLVFGEGPADARESTRTSSNEEGVFEVRGTFESSELVVNATKAGFLPRAAETVAPGTTGIRLMLSGAGSIRARVIRGEDLQGFPMQAVLLTPSEESAGAGGNPAVDRLGVRSDGRVSFEAVAAGRYTFAIQSQEGEELHRIEDVVAVAGEIVDLGQIHPTDVAAYVFRIVDTDGQPIPRPRARVLLPEGESRTTTFIGDLEGRIMLLTTRSPLDLSFEAPGHQAIELYDVRAGMELVLAPGPTARIHLDPLPQLAPSEHLIAQLRPVGPGTTARSIFRDGVVANVSVGEPGSYSLRFLLTRNTDDENGGQSASTAAMDHDGPPLEIGEGLTEFFVTLTDADLDEMRRSFP